jgi:hypothetical protein
MNSNPILLRKIRSIDVVITDSWHFVRQEFKPLTKITLIYLLPFLILFAVFQIWFQQKISGIPLQTDPEATAEKLAPLLKSLMGFILFLLFIQSLVIGVIYTYIDSYDKFGRGNFEVSDISHLFFSNNLKVIITSLIIYIGVMVGAMFCILPGLVFLVFVILGPAIVISEKTSALDAVSKSWNLVSKRWFETLAVILATFVISILAMLVLSLPGFFTGFVSFGFENAKFTPEDFPLWYKFWTGITLIVQMLVFGFSSIIIAVYFYSFPENQKSILSSESDMQ